jgi:hypothetical protein
LQIGELEQAPDGRGVRPRKAGEVFLKAIYLCMKNIARETTENERSPLVLFADIQPDPLHTRVDHRFGFED